MASSSTSNRALVVVRPPDAMDIDHDGSVFSAKILNNDLIYFSIFAATSARALLRLARTSRAAYGAVNDYLSRAFDINNQLARFFDDFLGFRSLQARTASLISGSTALQFFDRTFYPESDLDVYVPATHKVEVGRWILAQGYRFAPYSFQDPDFETAIVSEDDNIPMWIYVMTGSDGVFTFKKPSPHDPKLELKVQVIVATNTPIEAIIGSFHSSGCPLKPC